MEYLEDGRGSSERDAGRMPCSAGFWCSGSTWLELTPGRLSRLRRERSLWARSRPAIGSSSCRQGVRTQVESARDDRRAPLETAISADVRDHPARRRPRRLARRRCWPTPTRSPRESRASSRRARLLDRATGRSSPRGATRGEVDDALGAGHRQASSSRQIDVHTLENVPAPERSGAPNDIGVVRLRLSGQRLSIPPTWKRTA